MDIQHSVLPLLIENDQGEVVEQIYCSALSGGLRYKNGMPKDVHLTRELSDGNVFSGVYVLHRKRFTIFFYKLLSKFNTKFNKK